MFTLIVAIGTNPLQSGAATARFWLSNSDNGPAAPTIDVLAGTIAEIAIWARPAPGQTLNAFSLNIVAEQPGAVSFQDVVVQNPLLESPAHTYRHQLVFDSTIEVGPPENPIGLNVQPDRIDGFSGLTFFDAASELPFGGGIGPECQDALCGLGSGSPAWHVATVRFETGEADTATELFLEIGAHGIWHAGEDPTDTSALLGVGPSAAELHQWSVAEGEIGVCNPADPAPDFDCRDMHKGQPDAVINVVSTISDADFDDDNDVDSADFLTWQRGFGAGSTHAEGDANGNSLINGEDLDLWQAQFGAGNLPLIATVPEPTSLALLAVLFVCVLSAHATILRRSKS